MRSLALIAALFGSAQGQALTAHDLAGVAAAPPPGAAAPLQSRFEDERGAPLTLGQAMGGRPTVLVFADYTCTYLCGPALVLTAAALDASGLKPDRDYSLVVIGFDPKDGPAEARALRARRLHPGAGAAARLLSEGPAARIAAGLGYRYLYDAKLGQYAHDLTVYVLAPSGRVSAVLPEIGLSGPMLARAIGEARTHPPPAALPAPLRILCYCLQPLVGAYDGPAVTGLRIAGAAMLLGIGAAAAAVGLKRRRERRT